MEYISIVKDFFDSPFFIVTGGITATLSVLGMLYAIACWVLGISPSIIRLGYALWQREIAIFGDEKSLNELTELLVDSKIFKKKNIIQIRENNISKAKNRTLFLIDWNSMKDKLDEILGIEKNHQVAVLIYAPTERIPDDIIKRVANKPNTIVVNFKGRLLNDILNSMITTSYDSK